VKFDFSDQLLKNDPTLFRVRPQDATPIGRPLQERHLKRLTVWCVSRCELIIKSL